MNDCVVHVVINGSLSDIVSLCVVHDLRDTCLKMTIVLICFLQSLPVYGQSDDLSESNSEIYKIFKAGQRGFDELCTKREPDLITNYADILANASNILKAEQQGLDQLCTGMEPDLTATCAADILKIISPLEAKLKEIYNRYPKQIVERIFAKAIKKIVSKQNLLLLPDLLWSIYEPENSELFEMLLRAPLQAYLNVSRGQHRDKYKFFQNFSFMLYNIKKDGMYDRTSPSLKSSVEDVIKILPSNFILLFFKPRFCIVNVKHTKHVSISSYNPRDSSGREIYLLNNNNVLDSACYVKATFKEVDSANGKQLKVILQGTAYKTYYVLSPEKKLLFGLPDLYSLWNIEHLDDSRVYFVYDGFTMCAAEEKGNTKRKIRSSNGYFATDSGCEWTLVECNFKT